MPHATDLDAVVTALREGERFVVATHENPDGDALGSLLGMHLVLTGIGKDSVMTLDASQRLPAEYRFLELDSHGLLRELPADVEERTLVAVDCAQESRIAATGALTAAARSVNVDHHHDNTRFGDVDLVVSDASSTGEIVADLAHALGAALTPALAEALYTALVTDTGRFQYTNTTPKALRLAAELVEAGADVKRVFQRVYESIDFAKLKLLGAALERATVHEGGRVVVSYLTRDDFERAHAEEPYSEGIIDHLRAVDGAELAVLIRELPDDAAHAAKVSLRASVDELDVSAIARRSGGGGHRQAAGFSSDLEPDGITAFVLDAFREVRGATAAP